jgi:uncharacterized protein with ATP-grasp and redox domains
MKVQPECVPCLLKRVLYETNLVNKGKSYEALKGAAMIIGNELNNQINSAKLATKIHGEAYRIIGSTDPYEEMKRRSNEVAKTLLPHAKEIIVKSGNPLRAAILCSIVGNVLDFGIESPVDDPEEIPHKFDALYGEGLGHDDTGKIEELLVKGKNVIFFADNCGEIVFDTLLLRELNKHNIDLTFVVRGQPILSDATMNDVEELGIDKMVDEVETTNAYAVGVNTDKVGSNLKKKMENADLIISKGMANWESFSDEEYKPIAYLMRIKCDPVGRALNLKKGMNAAILQHDDK